MSTNFLTITIAKSLKTGLRLVGIIAFALTASWIFSWLIAYVLTIIYRPWESTTPSHYRDFQRWKQPWELGGSTVGVILLVIYLMRYSRLGFSREPTVEDENINEDLQPPVDEESLIPPNEHLPPAPNEHPLPPPNEQPPPPAYEHPLYQQPLPLFNEEPLLPFPNIGQQELRWSAQALAELQAVPGYRSEWTLPWSRDDHVLGAESRSDEASKTDRLRAWLKNIEDPTAEDLTFEDHASDGDHTSMIIPAGIHTLEFPLRQAIIPATPRQMLAPPVSPPRPLTPPVDQREWLRYSRTKWTPQSPTAIGSGNSSPCPLPNKEVAWERSRFRHANF